MKKKAKLIATLSSLGLALAMMVFAVYAATSVTFKITTNIEFEATKHVQATIVAKDTGKLASAPTNASYTIPAETGANQTIGINPDGTDNGAVTDVKFKGAELDATNRYYGYQITITNNDDENKLPVTVIIPEHTGTGYTVTYKVNGTQVSAGENVVEVLENKAGQNNVYVITCDVVVNDLAGNSVTINEAHLNIEKILLGVEEKEEQLYTLDIDFDIPPVTLPSTMDCTIYYGNEEKYIGLYLNTEVDSIDIKENELVEIVINDYYDGDPIYPYSTISLLDSNGQQIEYLEENRDESGGNLHVITLKFYMSDNMTLSILAGYSEAGPIAIEYTLTGSLENLDVQGSCVVTISAGDNITDNWSGHDTLYIFENTSVTITVEVSTTGSMISAPSATLYDESYSELGFLTEETIPYENGNGYTCTYTFNMYTNCILEIIVGESA